MAFIRRHKTMILASILFFYLGCGITISLMQIDCVVGSQSFDTNNDEWSSIEYAVLIMSGPDNEAKRDAVRTTWCNFLSNIILENGEMIYKWNHTWTKPKVERQFAKCFFVIGTQHLSEIKLLQLKAENSRSSDIILLENFEDSYKNLAQKLIHSLKWFNKHLSRLKYLIKCDDDSFVRVDLIIRDLDAFAPEMRAPTIQEFVSYKVCIHNPLKVLNQCCC